MAVEAAPLRPQHSHPTNSASAQRASSSSPRASVASGNDDSNGQSNVLSFSLSPSLSLRQHRSSSSSSSPPLLSPKQVVSSLARQRQTQQERHSSIDCLPSRFTLPSSSSSCSSSVGSSGSSSSQSNRSSTTGDVIIMAKITDATKNNKSNNNNSNNNNKSRWSFPRQVLTILTILMVLYLSSSVGMLLRFRSSSSSSSSTTLALTSRTTARFGSNIGNERNNKKSNKNNYLASPETALIQTSSAAAAAAAEARALTTPKQQQSSLLRASSSSSSSAKEEEEEDNIPGSIAVAAAAAAAAPINNNSNNNNNNNKRTVAFVARKDQLILAAAADEFGLIMPHNSYDNTNTILVNSNSNTSNSNHGSNNSNDQTQQQQEQEQAQPLEEAKQTLQQTAAGSDKSKPNKVVIRSNITNSIEQKPVPGMFDLRTASSYYRQQTGDRLPTWANKMSIALQVAPTVPAHERICLVHVGKAAGSTVACRLAFDYGCRTDLIPTIHDIETSALVQHTTNLIHNDIIDCPIHQTNPPLYYVMTLRHPIRRIQSWFRYEYPYQGSKDPFWTAKKLLFIDCQLDTLQKLADAGMQYEQRLLLNNTKTNTSHDNDNDATPSPLLCSQRAYWAMQGTVGFVRHNAYHYQHFRSLLPSDAVLGVLRTEHLTDDWYTLERWVQGGFIPIREQQQQHQQQQQQENGAANANTTKDLDEDSHSKALQAGSNRSIRDRGPGNSDNLTPDAMSWICRAMCHELHTYVRILQEAVNLSPIQVNTSIQELYETCPEQQSNLLWPCPVQI